MNVKKSGLAIATAAAALFATGAVVVPAQAADAGFVKCSGINGCKGTSECKTATSGCKGHNACKGQGWVKKDTAEACTGAGGKVM